MWNAAGEEKVVAFLTANSPVHYVAGGCVSTVETQAWNQRFVHWNFPARLPQPDPQYKVWNTCVRCYAEWSGAWQSPAWSLQPCTAPTSLNYLLLYVSTAPLSCRLLAAPRATSSASSSASASSSWFETFFCGYACNARTCPQPYLRDKPLRITCLQADFAKDSVGWFVCMPRTFNIL